jgi:Zn finger protein HypA/HybF involved in hydrogenase expression
LNYVGTAIIVWTENKVVKFEDPLEEKKKELDCLRCKVRLIYSGNFKFHEGTRFGIFGNIFEAFVNRESFDLYICPSCGKVEFFSPQIGQIYTKNTDTQHCCTFKGSVFDKSCFAYNKINNSSINKKWKRKIGNLD